MSVLSGPDWFDQIINLPVGTCVHMESPDMAIYTARALLNDDIRVWGVVTEFGDGEGAHNSSDKDYSYINGATMRFISYAEHALRKGWIINDGGWKDATTDHI